MRSVGNWLFASMILSSALFGCGPRREVVVVREARPAPPCRGGVWVEGHHGRRGKWHPGHWRCPGVVEVVEVD